MRKLAITIIALIILSSMVYAEDSISKAKMGYVDKTVNQYTSWKSGTISFFNSSYYEQNRAKAATRVKTYVGNRIVMRSVDEEKSVISNVISTSLHSRQPKQINAKPVGVQRVLGDYNVKFIKQKKPRNKYGD